MIPKRLFLFWENDKMSWMRYMTFYSFRKFNPDWQIDLYYNEKTMKPEDYPEYIKEGGRRQDFWYYDGPDYFEKLKDLDINFIQWDTDEVELQKFKNITPSGKSNVFKWHQLWKNGGVYADTDILFFKPMGDLYNTWNNNNTNVVITQNPRHICIGLMASTPDNEFFKDIFYNTFKFESQTQYQMYGTINVYDLYGGSKVVLPQAIRKYPNLKFSNLEMDVVYYFNHKDIKRVFNQNNTDDGCLVEPSDFPECSIGYHWYAGGAISQAINNQMNHQNYTKYNNLFSKLIKKYFPES